MTDDDSNKARGEFAVHARTHPASDVLVIAKRNGKPLSKEQRSFNRLTRRIAALEQRMSSDRERLDALMAVYHELVAPAERDRAAKQLELARALAAASKRFGLQKRQMADLREMMLDVFDEIFAVTKPDVEMEAFYDEWSDVSYRDEVRGEAERLKRRMAESLRDGYDITMDMSEYDDSPEAMARFIENARQKVREAEAGQPREPGRRRRAARQEDREALLRERAAISKKSVRDVYLALAKVLHPDAVADATERAVREDFMKQATTAYRHGDVAALLKLELRWVTRDEAGGTALGDEALRAYIPALNEQVARLERALVEQLFDPQFAPVSPVVGMPERIALGHLRNRANALRKDSAYIDKETAFVNACASKRDLTAFVHEYFRTRDAGSEWEVADLS